MNILAAATLTPFFAVRFLWVARGSAPAMAAATGLAIVVAAFCLGWGVEGIETVIPQGVALDFRAFSSCLNFLVLTFGDTLDG